MRDLDKFALPQGLVHKVKFLAETGITNGWREIVSLNVTPPKAPWTCLRAKKINSWILALI
jgi:hypothetical protein